MTDFCLHCLFAFLDNYGVAVMLHLSILDLSAVSDNFVLVRLIGFLSSCRLDLRFNVIILCKLNIKLVRGNVLIEVIEVCAE